MSVTLQIKISQPLYEHAQRVAAAEHLPVDEVVAYWAEIGKEALARPAAVMPLLEAELAAGASLDEDSPDSERLSRLWAALAARR